MNDVTRKEFEQLQAQVRDVAAGVIALEALADHHIANYHDLLSYVEAIHKTVQSGLHPRLRR